MLFRVFLRCSVLVAALLVMPAVADACDNQLALRLDAQIREANGAKAWETMNDAALRLAGLYDGCAASERGKPYFEDAMRMANALISAGVAELERGHDAEWRRPFTVAHSLFFTIASTIDVPPDIRDDAREHLAFVEKRLPWLVQTPIDSSVMPHARSPAAVVPPPATPAPPVSDFDVLQTWTTPFAGPYQTLHVKLNLHPAATATVVASDFRLVITSRANGREVVYGRAGAAPAYRKTDWTSNTNQYKLVPTVDPSDDLGAQGSLTLHGGDSITRVVTFVVRSDADIGADTVATLTWNHR